MTNKDYSNVISKIDAVAAKIYDDFQKIEIPSLNLPTRTKANIKFDDKLNLILALVRVGKFRDGISKFTYSN